MGANTRRAIQTGLAAFAAAAIMALPLQAAPTNEVRLIADLADGSRIVGEPLVAAVAIRTELGAIQVPLAKVRTLTFREDHEGVAIDLANGDHLTGTHEVGKLQLKTAFGTVAIDSAFLRRISCVPLRRGAAGREGLVLWNRLDSEQDVVASVVGPAGKLNGGRFVDGKFGKAIELNMREQMGVTFPFELLSTPAGCVEFWARAIDFPARQTDGATPGLIGFTPAEPGDGFMLFFNANDGNANGGLCLRSGMAYVGTGGFGSWTYERAIGGSISEWHHYAMVWSSAGLPGIGDGKRKGATFVDGVLNSNHGFFGEADRLNVLPAGTRFGLLNHQGLTSGRVVFDNLKVWNVAKTDFSDRNEE